jgi:hypothetical protein
VEGLKRPTTEPTATILYGNRKRGPRDLSTRYRGLYGEVDPRDPRVVYRVLLNYLPNRLGLRLVGFLYYSSEKDN